MADLANVSTVSRTLGGATARTPHVPLPHPHLDAPNRHGRSVASRRQSLIAMGAFVTACGTATPTGAPTIIATTGRPLSLAPVFALMRPPGEIVGAVPSTVELPPRPPVSLRVTTTVDGAVDLIRRGQATAAIVPRGSATGITGWKLANGVEVPPVSPATFASPGPIRLVVRRDSVGGPRLASGRLAPRDRPFRFAYLPTP